MKASDLLYASLTAAVVAFVIVTLSGSRDTQSREANGAHKVPEAQETKESLLKQWKPVGQNVSYRLIDIEGHRYLITIRNGIHSYNASTIHAASCPGCNKESDNAK